MRKRKLQLNPTQLVNLEGFFSSYDTVTLLGLLNTFEQHEGWKLFQAYTARVQRVFEINALDLTAKEEKGAAYASGYAKACEDIRNQFMEGLKQTLLNKNPVLENPREEEQEPQTQFD